MSLYVFHYYLGYKENNFYLNKEIFHQKINFLAVEPARKLVQPLPAEAEPAAGAHLLATEAQDKVAVTHLPIGESGIIEFEMAVSLLMGIGEGCPYGQTVGVKPGKSLAESEGEAEVSPVVGIHAERAANDAVSVFYNKNSGCFLDGRILS